MVGQWMQTKGASRGCAAALVLAAAFVLSACVSEEQAVDMGLATKCAADGTVVRLGDPAGRYVAKTDTQTCRGPRRDRYSETALEIIDCSTATVLRAGVTRNSADQARRGPDYNNAAAVEQARLRLRVGLADLTQTEANLRAAGVPVTRGTGGIEHCTKLAASAAVMN